MPKKPRKISFSSSRINFTGPATSAAAAAGAFRADFVINEDKKYGALVHATVFDKGGNKMQITGSRPRVSFRAPSDLMYAFEAQTLNAQDKDAIVNQLLCKINSEGFEHQPVVTSCACCMGSIENELSASPAALVHPDCTAPLCGLCFSNEVGQHIAVGSSDPFECQVQGCSATLTTDQILNAIPNFGASSPFHGLRSRYKFSDISIPGSMV